MRHTKVSEHLSEFHRMSKAHHESMIDAHEGALEKAAGTDHAAAEAFHKSAISSHEKMRDYHEAAMEDCQKAAVDSLNKSNALVPDHIHGIIPDYPGVRAVPRHGQRPLDKVAVDPMIENLIEMPD